MARRLVVNASVIAKVSRAVARVVCSASSRGRAVARCAEERRTRGDRRHRQVDARQPGGCAEPFLRLRDIGENQPGEARTRIGESCNELGGVRHPADAEREAAVGPDAELARGRGAEDHGAGLGEPGARRGEVVQRGRRRAAGCTQSERGACERIDADELHDAPAHRDVPLHHRGEPHRRPLRCERPRAQRHVQPARRCRRGPR